MTNLQIEAIRKRCWTAISPDTAKAAGPNQAGEWMKQADIQQFIAYQFLPDDSQLARLSCYLGVKL